MGYEQRHLHPDSFFSCFSRTYLILLGRVPVCFGVVFVATGSRFGSRFWGRALEYSPCAKRRIGGLCALEHESACCWRRPSTFIFPRSNTLSSAIIVFLTLVLTCWTLQRVCHPCVTAAKGVIGAHKAEGHFPPLGIIDPTTPPCSSNRFDARIGEGPQSPARLKGVGALTANGWLAAESSAMGTATDAAATV